MKQNDTLGKLTAQREALAARLSAAGKRIERLDGLEDVSALVAALDEKQTLESALVLLDSRIATASAEARQVQTEQETAERIRLRQAEQKTHASALQAVLGDVVKLDGHLQALIESRRRLAVLGDWQLADVGAVSALDAAVRTSKRAWRIGLPERNPEAEQRQAAIEDCQARLERAQRRKDMLQQAARDGWEIPRQDWAAALADVASAKRALAIASGQTWTAQDEAQAQQPEGLVFTPRRSIAEIEQLAAEQERRFAANPGWAMQTPSRTAPGRRR